MNTRQYYVYILTNHTNTVLYTGVTNDLVKRVWEHKNKFDSNSFTSKYNVSKLVYYEVLQTSYDAISREKQIKAGSRIRKLALIKKINLEFRDLYEEII